MSQRMHLAAPSNENLKCLQRNGGKHEVKAQPSARHRSWHRFLVCEAFVVILNLYEAERRQVPLIAPLLGGLGKTLVQ